MSTCQACAGSGKHLKTGQPCPSCSPGNETAADPQALNYTGKHDAGAAAPSPIRDGARFAGAKAGQVIGTGLAGPAGTTVGGAVGDSVGRAAADKTWNRATGGYRRVKNSAGAFTRAATDPLVDAAAADTRPDTDSQQPDDDTRTHTAGSSPSGNKRRTWSDTSTALGSHRQHRHAQQAATAAQRDQKRQQQTRKQNDSRKKVALAGTGMSIGMILALLLGVPAGGLALLTLLSNPAFAGQDVLPPKPSKAQCAALPDGWCDVLWAVQVRTRNSGGVAVPWSMLAGIAKTQTEFGRYSPSDSIDRDPGRVDTSLPSGSLSPAAAMATAPAAVGRKDTLLLGDSLAVGAGQYLTRDKRLTVTVNAVVGRPVTAGIAAISGNSGSSGVGGDQGNGEPAAIGTIPSNVVIDLGTNGIDNYAKNIATMMKLLAGRNTYWLTLHAVGSGPNRGQLATQGNTILAAATKKFPNLHLIDTAALIRSHPAYVGSDGVHLSAAGYKARAQLIGDTLAGTGTADTDTNTQTSDDTPAAAPADTSSGTGSTAAATGSAFVLPLKDLWSKYFTADNFHVPGSWSLGFHTGQDFGAPDGTPIYAVADATVIGAGYGESGSCGNSDAWGNAVVLKVNDTTGTKEVSYNHLSTIKVTKGQHVAAGQLLGTTGHTGRAFGPHLHFEVRNAGTCPWGGNPDTSLVDPVTWLKGAKAGPVTGDGNLIADGGGYDNSEADIPDQPDWMSSIDTLDDPAAATTCPVDTPAPAISGAYDSQGPYLLNSYETKNMRAQGWDPQNVCQSSLYVAQALRTSGELSSVTGDHSDRYTSPQQHTDFWADALTDVSLFVSPTADDTDCSAIPATAATTVDKINWAIGCWAAKKKHLNVVTGYSNGTPTTATFTGSVAILRDEAVKAAAIQSKLGTAPCSATQKYAGVFGLTTSQAASVTIDGQPADRCDVDDNILAGTKLLIDGESVPVKSRDTSAGPFAGMLGGWGQFGWVTASIGDFATKGPLGDVWTASTDCQAAAGLWVTQLTDASSPLAGRDLRATPTELANAVAAASSGHVSPAQAPACAGAPSDGINIMIAGTLDDVAGPSRDQQAADNLAAWVAAQPHQPASLVERLSTTGVIATVDPSVDTSVSADAPDPLGITATAKDIAAYSQGVAGGPVNYVWDRLNFDAGSCFNGTGAAAVTSTGATSTGPGKNPGIVYRYFKSLGWTDEGIAGVLGNMQQESGVNPAAVESNGEGHGLAQWSFGRRTALLDAAAKAGKPWQDIGFQLDFMAKEITKSYSSLVPMLKTTHDVQDATVRFHNIYEGSADSPAFVWSVRGGYAKAHLANIKAGKYGATTGSATISTDSTTASDSSTQACGTGVSVVTDGNFEAYAQKFESLVGVSSIDGIPTLHACLGNAERVWAKVGGSRSNGGMPTAASAGFKYKEQGLLKPYTPGMTVPRGWLVFWNGAVGSSAGHVAMSDGKGNTVNNWGSANSGAITVTKLATQVTSAIIGIGPPTVFGPVHK